MIASGDSRSFRGAGTFETLPGEVYGIRIWRVFDRLAPRSIQSAPAWKPGINTAECLAIPGQNPIDPTGQGRKPINVWAKVQPGSYPGDHHRISISINVQVPWGHAPKFTEPVTLTHKVLTVDIPADRESTIVLWDDGTISAYDPRELGPTPHDTPDDECHCGFYAFFSPAHEEIENSFWFDTSVTLTVRGVIRGFGRTLIGDRGFRCEKAEIIALLDPGFPHESPSAIQIRNVLTWHYPDIPVLPTRAALTNFVRLSSPRDF